MRSVFATMLEVAGAAAVVWAAYELSVWAAVALAGAGLIVLGYALGAPPRARRPKG